MPCLVPVALPGASLTWQTSHCTTLHPILGPGPTLPRFKAGQRPGEGTPTPSHLEHAANDDVELVFTYSRPSLLGDPVRVHGLFSRAHGGVMVQGSPWCSV